MNTASSRAASGPPAPASRGWAESLSAKVGIVTAGTFMSLGLSALLGVAVARILGPAGLAHYTTVTISAILFAQLSDGGLAGAFGFYGRHRPEALRSLLLILRRHLIASTMTAAGAVWVVRAFGGESVKDLLAPAWFSAIIVAFIALNTAGQTLLVLVLALGFYRQHAKVVTGQAALQLLLVGAAAALPHTTWRVLVVALTCSLALLVFWQASFLWHHAPPGGIHVSTKECYRYGLRIKWAEIMKTLTGRLDLLIVSSILAPAEVGLYAVSMSLRELGMTPLRTYAGVLQNLLASRHRDAKGGRDLVIGSLLLQTGLSIVLSVIVALAMPYLLPLLFGRAYGAVYGPAALLFTSTIFSSAAGICLVAFNMWGYPGMTSRIYTMSGLVAPPLVWFFTQKAGLYGAAAGAVVSAAIACLFSIVALKSLQGYTWGDFSDVTKRMPRLMSELTRGAFAAARRQYKPSAGEV